MFNDTPAQNMKKKKKKGRKKIIYLTMHSKHFIYGYITSDIWKICCHLLFKPGLFRFVFCNLLYL